MLLRTKNKQLTNVNVITLKKQDKKYEIAVYPNKLYEYRHDGLVSLDKIMHSTIVYRNISTGDVCSENDLSLLWSFIKSEQAKNNACNGSTSNACVTNKSEDNRMEIIRYILMNGHEQKAHETSSYELSSVEKQILEIIQNKVTYNGTYASKDILQGFIKKVWNVKNEDPKKQASGIIKKLEELGFERVSFKVKVEVGDLSGFFNYLKQRNSENGNFDNTNELMQGISKTEDGVLVKSDILPDFINYCEDKSLIYIVSKNAEIMEEEIC